MTADHETEIATNEDERVGQVIRHVLANAKVSSSREYRTLAQAVVSEPEFRARVRAVLAGMGIRILDFSATDGIVVTGIPGSPFSGRIDDYADGRLNEDNAAENRMVRGSAIVAVVACAFPGSAPSGAAVGEAFTVDDVVALLLRAAQQALPITEGDEGERPDEDQVLARAVLRMPQASAGTRRGTRSLAEIAFSVIGKLQEQGYVAALPADAEGREMWRPLGPLSAVVRDAADRRWLSKLRTLSADALADRTAAKEA